MSISDNTNSEYTVDAVCWVEGLSFGPAALATLLLINARWANILLQLSSQFINTEGQNVFMVIQSNRFLEFINCSLLLSEYKELIFLWTKWLHIVCKRRKRGKSDFKQNE